jgi:hypothetical protein
MAQAGPGMAAPIAALARQASHRGPAADV